MSGSSIPINFHSRHFTLFTHYTLHFINCQLNFTEKGMPATSKGESRRVMLYSRPAVDKTRIMKHSGTFRNIPEHRIVIIIMRNICMSGFMKTVLKKWTPALSGCFFLARNYPQSRRYKNWKESQSFFLPLPVCLPFIALLSLFFACFTWPREGLKV